MGVLVDRLAAGLVGIFCTTIAHRDKHESDQEMPSLSGGGLGARWKRIVDCVRA